MLHQRRIDPAPLLASAGIPTGTSEPVTNAQYGRLWLAIARRIDDEFFGLAARSMRLGSYVLMGHVVLHASTLEQALRRALRFLDVVLGDPRGTLHQRDGYAEIVLTEHAGLWPAFAGRTFWLFLMGLMCWLIGRRIQLTRLDFACPAPNNREDYDQFFGAPVSFGQPQTRLIFAASYLALPPIRDEDELKTFMRAAPANILLRYRHDRALSNQIRERLRRQPIVDWPHFDTLASELHMSSATLRRRLRIEGQSFQAIRDELRYIQAQQWLRQGDASVDTIATRLGYAEPSAFHRAFFNWAGQTPGSFRKSKQRVAHLSAAAGKSKRG